MWTTAVAPVPPRVCVSPRRAPTTWRFPACPRSCLTISTACATPVAPTGWPRAFRPPEVFTEIFPFNAVRPSAVAGPPFPFSTNRRSSIARISEIVKLSWTSATWMSFGSSRASWNARLPATTVASIIVRSRRSWRARKSLACPEPAMRIGVSVNMRAFCISQRTTAAAPSERGAQSNNPSGSATHGACRTVSSVISLELGLGIQRAVLVILHRDGGHLFPRGAVFVHVSAGYHRVQARARRSEHGLPLLVRGGRQDLRSLDLADVRHLFGTAHDDDVVHAGRDGEPPLHARDLTARAAAFHADRREVHVRKAGVIADERRHVLLVTECRRRHVPDLHGVDVLRADLGVR